MLISDQSPARRDPLAKSGREIMEIWKRMT